MNIRTALKEGIAQLRAATVSSDTLAAELLLLHVLGRDRAWTYAHPEEPLSQADAQRFFSLIERRARGEPTQHLTGKQEFWGLEFLVTPDVLIPRPETEHVVEVALDRLALCEVRAGRRQTLTGAGLVIAEVGTGSGCIAVALAKELPAAAIYATDVSARALAVARLNAERHGVADRIRFVQCHLLERIGAWQATSRERSSGGLLRFDLIASNPPYVGRSEAATLDREVREHEPEVALYGGGEGYGCYPGLLARFRHILKSGRRVVSRVGTVRLASCVALFDRHG